MKKQILLVIILLGIFSIQSFTKDLDLSGKVFTIKKVILPTIKEGEPKKAADFIFEIEGKEYKFSEITKNKVVFLNFWGTWCPPCRNEIPDIIEIQKQLIDKNFIVIGIASERSDAEINKVISFAKVNGINYPNFMKTKELADYYGGIKYVPSTFLINKQGIVVDEKVGGNSKEVFMKWIEPVLNK